LKKAVRSLETSGTGYPVTRRHTRRKRNPQLHRSENFKTCFTTESYSTEVFCGIVGEYYLT